MPRLLLASSSPRRRELLAALGVEFEVRPADVDERPRPGESAAAMVSRLALEKASTIHAASGGLVIGADTAVVLDEAIFGKPRHESDAVAMLLALSGRTHRVLTGVAVVGDHGAYGAQSATEVTFRDIRRDEARRYWQTGEPRDKAGAYAIQGIGGAFVEAINGSYSGVVGLPVFETAALLGRAGIDVIAASRKDE